MSTPSANTYGQPTQSSPAARPGQGIYLGHFEVALLDTWIALPHGDLEVAAFLSFMRAYGATPGSITPGAEALIRRQVTQEQERRFALCLYDIKLVIVLLNDFPKQIVYIAEVLRTEMMDTLDIYEEHMESRLKKDMARRK